ncbi:Retrovirus-related Pol polyprotein from transposon TNT 1-94 [Dendrobium catenatum]|uniref:Retrovirus-related Pol polyprotein from transposon TNT 1-94 n=1 Tax=Dendrobium catenatum TaxID=906689 RepID=A0A2I0WS67_9ASPA|nr:Retrovirus-related Pol polyprotein from transposon TNT 1-94 [Dendrobium catenatum]
MQTPLSLDNLYALLLSEEIHVASEVSRQQTTTDPSTALYSSVRGRGRRLRGKGANQQNSSRNSNPNASTTCQICLKKGHSAFSCWHRLNQNYKPSSVTNSNTALVAENSRNTTEWFLDSGASSHLTNALENLSVSAPYRGSDTVTIGDGSSVGIDHSGTGLLSTPHRKLLLTQLFHTPKLQYNLLSISQLTKDNNISIVFDPNGFYLKDLKTQEVLLQGPCRNGLYQVQTTKPSSTYLACSTVRAPTIPWHNRFGHPNNNTLQFLASTNPQLHIEFNNSCMQCNVSKAHKMSFDTSVNRKKFALELLHSDIWGPAPSVSVQGFQYYAIFVDDCTRFTWLFPLKRKSDIAQIFFTFKQYIEKYLSRSIKCIRTDGGGEYLSHTFTEFLKTNGIMHQISCPYTPEQNGVAERKHRHIIETTRSLLHTAHIPYTYWPDAVLTAVYLINRLPSRNTKNLSPFELLHNTKPNYTHLRTFGCACYPLLPSHTRHKLQPKSKQCVFIGYSDTHKGYKCLDVSNNKVFVSRHLTFDEQMFPFSIQQDNKLNNHIDPPAPSFMLIPESVSRSQQHTSQSHLDKDLPTDIQTIQRESVPVPTENCISAALPSQPCSPAAPISHHMITRRQTGSLKPVNRLNLLHQLEPVKNHFTPTAYSDAVKYPEWRKAMADEILALHQQGTWSLVPQPTSQVLGCKWTYRLKLHSDGSIAKYKVRLVALGNNQEFGLNYTETFSPVAKLPTIRILLTIAFSRDWQIHQLDVANAFLHGTLSETVFMHQPKGFEDPNHPNYVCRLHKALYGLKQAPRQWYNTFTAYLLSLGFTNSVSDPSLFLFNKNNIQLFLLIYVDDILFTGNNVSYINQILDQLSNRFAMKNLGHVHNFLGIKIDRNSDSLFLSQAQYAMTLLDTAQLTRCNPIHNPTCTKAPADPPQDSLLSNPMMYRRLVGSLQYLTLTRPDIAYSVNLLSQHMHNPSLHDAFLLKRLLRYIKGTLHFGLPISKSNFTLNSFSDADWAGDPESRKSTSGFCSFLGDTLVSWTVKKQQTVARSSTESEYRALAALTANVIWIRKLLTELGVPQSQPTNIYCDNMSAIALANNPVFHARTKHIEIDQRFIRDHIQNKNICISPISTTDQIADIFTKSLPSLRFKTLRLKLTVIENPSVCGGLLTDKSQIIK